MPIRTHGTSGACQTVSGNLEYYTMYAVSQNAISDPENATGVNMRVTGDINDESQKIFEVIVQSISLRATPVIMNDPQATADLALVGAPNIAGEGFVWKFAVELQDVFRNYGPSGTVSDVGFLVDELDGIVLPNGYVIRTKISKNTEFTKTTGL